MNSKQADLGVGKCNPILDDNPQIDLHGARTSERQRYNSSGHSIVDSDESIADETRCQSIEADKQIIFDKAQDTEICEVENRICQDKTFFPSLGDHCILVSKVFHLLPHGKTFTNPIKVSIKLTKRLVYGKAQVIAFYSSTGLTERPHWEMLTDQNKKYQGRHILYTNETHCTISMPNLCLICVGELNPDGIPQSEKFDIFVGIVFDAEHIKIDKCETWLVKVKVLVSLTDSEDKDWQKLEVVKMSSSSNPTLGDVNIRVHDMDPKWNIDATGKDRKDVTVFQLQHGKINKIEFGFHSNNASSTDIFTARVRVHQENARNDCDCIVEDRKLLGNMMLQMPHVQTTASPDGVTHQLPPVTTELQLSDTASKIPTLVLEKTFDGMMDEISRAINTYPTDAGILQSLCEMLCFEPDLQSILETAEKTTVPPALLLLREWKNQTGGNVRQLREVYNKYVDQNKF